MNRIVSAEISNSQNKFGIEIEGRFFEVIDTNNDWKIDLNDKIQETLCSGEESSDLSNYKETASKLINRFLSNLNYRKDSGLVNRHGYIFNVLDAFYNKLGANPDERWKSGSTFWDINSGVACDKEPYTSAKEIVSDSELTGFAEISDEDHDGKVDSLTFKTPDGIDVSIKSYTKVNRETVLAGDMNADFCYSIDQSRKNVEQFLEPFDKLLEAAVIMFEMEPI